MNDNEIKLSPIEATAYYWIRIIRGWLDEYKKLNSMRNYNQNERIFPELFTNFTDSDWRKLYLQLVTDINDSIGSNGIDDDGLKIDTCMGGHIVINQAIFKITNTIIPDITLSGKNSKDIVTITSSNTALYWIKSIGTFYLPTEYEPNNILVEDVNKHRMAKEKR